MFAGINTHTVQNLTKDIDSVCTMWFLLCNRPFFGLKREPIDLILKWPFTANAGGKPFCLAFCIGHCVKSLFGEWRTDFTRRCSIPKARQNYSLPPVSAWKWSIKNVVYSMQQPIREKITMAKFMGKKRREQKKKTDNHRCNISKPHHNWLIKLNDQPMINQSESTGSLEKRSIVSKQINRIFKNGTI